MKVKDVKKVIIALAYIGLLASCSSEEMTTADGDNGRTPITLSARLDGMTRAANGLQGNTFAVDKVGVTIKKSDGTYLAQNKAFTIATDGTLTAPAGEKYYFPTDGTTLSVYAYVPYNATDMPTSFEVKKDQISNDNYIASDILYGVPSSAVSHNNGGNVELNFTHKCAKVVVSLTPGEGFTINDLTPSTLMTSEVSTAMTFKDATNGTFEESTESKSAITLGTYGMDMNGEPTYDTTSGTLTAAAVLIPQTIPAGTPFISLNFTGASASNSPLILSLPTALTLEAGKEYHFNLKANRSALMLNEDIAITNWGNVDKGSCELSNYFNLNNLESDLTVDSDSYLTGTTSKKITIADGVNVTLDGVTINNQIVCKGNATIYLKGTNKVTCTTDKKAGIEVGPTGTTLTINGDADGKIEVQGGQWGAGIGSGQDGSIIGNIIINSGIITATGGNNGAGIGSGQLASSCGDITITGGTVTAIGGNNGAGIGSGQFTSSCGDITITGGTVTATGGNTGAGIGSGAYKSSCGGITITGGTVIATGGYYGAGIGSGYNNSSCGNISIDMTGKSDYFIKVKAGSTAYCIGNGFTNSSVGEITITNATITLDDSNSSGNFFDPTPTFSGTVVIKNKNGENTTSSITHN